MVQISQATANSLREYRRKHTETIYLFTGGQGLPLRKDSLLLRKVFPSILKRAEITKPVTFHDLRHTAATRMLQVLPPHEVARRLGHSVDTLLKTYAHVMPHRASAAADDFDKLVGTG